MKMSNATTPAPAVENCEVMDIIQSRPTEHWHRRDRVGGGAEDTSFSPMDARHGARALPLEVSRHGSVHVPVQVVRSEALDEAVLLEHGANPGLDPRQA